MASTVASDDDELLLAPPEPIDSKYSNAVVPPLKTVTGKSVFDDDLPELAPIEVDVPKIDANLEAAKPETSTGTTQRPKKPITKPELTLPDVPLPDISLESPALIGSMTSLDDEEFSFPCKVCGSMLGTSRSRIGSSITCPDCYSPLMVPSLKKKAKTAEVKMDEKVASVTFAPIDSLSVRDPRGSAAKTKEMLDRAEQTMDEEREEFLDGTFDTKRWIGFLFGFLMDPLVVAAAVVAGFVTGFWFFAMATIGSWIGLEGTPALIARFALFCLFIIPIAGFICLCGIAILTMTANRAKRVREWPFAKLTESIGECAMVFASVLIASIPGGMLGVVLSSLNANPLVSMAFVLIGVWGFTPILLLSMIDKSSLFEPYSKAVWQSIKSRGEAWGAMYMQTGMVFGIVFTLMVVASLQSPFGDFFLGLVIPVACFFQFSQYGVLAGRISDITQMGFEGDFSED